MPTPSSRIVSACSCTSQSMPRACSISAVVSPPTPPPTMIAFILFTLYAAPHRDLAHPGTHRQPPGFHTVSALAAVAPGAVNAKKNRVKAEIRKTQLTLFDKIWVQHEVLKPENGNS